MKPRIKLPETIRAGETIEIKALVQHVMETGNRKDAEGKPIPRNIINTFRATFEGQQVFAADFGSGIAANPFIAFFLTVPASGELALTWIDDSGTSTTEKTRIEVQPASVQ
ncbi:MAG: thiosulfate oxidation carrier complex protein SoxZ [Hyphomicrobium sp.]